MRYTLALFALLAGCSTAAPVSDAGALPLGWSECPAECVPSCHPSGAPWCGDAPACIACEPLCGLPVGDAGEPEQVVCDASDFWCGGRIVAELPLGERCFRFGF